MKIKVSEATATQLDWLACKALYPLDKMTPTHRWVREGKNRTGAFIIPLVSTDWSQGGPIIEREKISVFDIVGAWRAYSKAGRLSIDGPTPLIAAMRCYAASKLGDEVDVPDELK